MSEPIVVSTEGIAAPTGGLADLGDRLTNIATNLRNRVGDLGGVWGDDKAGRKFRAEYEGPSAQMMTALPELARVLDSVAEGLRVMSLNYEAAEEQAGVHARNLMAPGDGPAAQASGRRVRADGQVSREALLPGVPPAAAPVAVARSERAREALLPGVPAVPVPPAARWERASEALLPGVPAVPAPPGMPAARRMAERGVPAEPAGGEVVRARVAVDAPRAPSGTAVAAPVVPGSPRVPGEASAER